MYQKALQRAKNQKNKLRQTIGTLIIFKQEQIVNNVRTRWLFGKDPNGDIIGTYRSKSYRAFKVVANSKAGGLVDLTLTGSLGNKLKVKKKGSLNYEIFSTDSKYEMIADKYGIEQFNLSQEQQKQLFDELYIEAINQYMQNVWLA